MQRIIIHIVVFGNILTKPEQKVQEKILFTIYKQLKELTF